MGKDKDPFKHEQRSRNWGIVEEGRDAGKNGWQRRKKPLWGELRREAEKERKNGERERKERGKGERDKGERKGVRARGEREKKKKRRQLGMSIWRE